jgi:hypothetical protein
MHYKHSHGADELLRAITEIRFRVGELAASDKKSRMSRTARRIR